MLKGEMIERHFREALRRIRPDPRPGSKLVVPDLPESERIEFELLDETDLQEIGTDQEGQWFERFDDTQSVISITDPNLAEGSIRAAGIDALAFYKSYRVVNEPPFRGRWGIFYLDQGIAFLSQKILSECRGIRQSGELAFRWLQAHEFFHFKFDLYALMAEGVIGHELWNPLRHAYRNHSTHLVEEALANHDVFQWARKASRGRAFVQCVRDCMLSQPGAYARFVEPQGQLASELAANLLDLNVNRLARRDDQASWVGKVPWLSTATIAAKRGCCCPEYIVPSGRHSPLWKPAWAIQVVKRVVDGPQVEKLLASSAASLALQWERTKRKLVESPALKGLNFKLWTREPLVWSVRIDDSFRAHLSPSATEKGTWTAERLGPHKAMGHG